jgi:hypothetical protein
VWILIFLIILILEILLWLLISESRLYSGRYILYITILHVTKIMIFSASFNKEWNTVSHNILYICCMSEKNDTYDLDRNVSMNFIVSILNPKMHFKYWLEIKTIWLYFINSAVCQINTCSFTFIVWNDRTTSL